MLDVLDLLELFDWRSLTIDKLLRVETFGILHRPTIP